MPNPNRDLGSDEFVSAGYVRAVNDHREGVNAAFRREQVETNERDQRNIENCARTINAQNESLQQIAGVINSLLEFQRTAAARLQVLEEFVAEMRLRPPAQTINVTIPDRMPPVTRTKSAVTYGPNGRIESTEQVCTPDVQSGFDGSVTLP